jgi:hypothetical protein
MVKSSRKGSANKSEVAPKAVSDLGRVLRKISDDYVSGGGKVLSRRELEREVAERRGAR